MNYLRLPLALATAVLVAACGGSSGSTSDPENEQGTLVDKSGVWAGTLGYGDTVIMITENNEAYGFSVGAGDHQGEYRSLRANFGDRSEVTTEITFWDHPASVSAVSSDGFNPFARTESSVTYRLNFIEAQTVSGEGQNGSRSVALTYQPQFENAQDVPAGGKLFRHYYRSATDSDGHPLYNLYEVDLSIASDGSISGRTEDGGFNWDIPTGTSEFSVSGSLASVSTLPAGVFELELTRTSVRSGNEIGTPGFVIPSVPLPGHDELIMGLEEDSGEPYVLLF